MGVAILSGTLQSLEARLALPLAQQPKEDAPVPSGVSTPTSSQFLDAPDSALPERFIATVGREETARKLKRTFKEMGRLGEAVEVLPGTDNVTAVQQSDVILVWWVMSLLTLTHSSKPQLAKQILLTEGMSDALDGKLVISICAGVTISQLRQWCPTSNVVRAMPNTPCKVCPRASRR